MQQHPENQSNQMAQNEMQQAIQNTLSCSATCIQAARNIQRTGGDRSRQDHIHMLEDCADMCQTAAHFMQHSSLLYGYVTRAAAHVTLHCGEECDRVGETACAYACKDTAQALDYVSKLVSY
jgi:hypothetical protein